jgi:SagB-type dehydrogenase family enzyme
MERTLWLSLLPRVRCHLCGDELVLKTGRDRVTYRNLTPALIEAFATLTTTGEYESELHDGVSQRDPESISKLCYYLHNLDSHGWLARSYRIQGSSLMTVLPLSNRFVFAEATIDPETRYSLCRFAYIRREAQQLVMQSPLTQASVALFGHRAAAIPFLLTRPNQARELYVQNDDLRMGCLQLLLRAGMVRAEKQKVSSSEKWNFHDLLLHRSSRSASMSEPAQGHYPYAGRITPPPALKPMAPMRWVDLRRSENTSQPKRRPDDAEVRRDPLTPQPAPRMTLHDLDRLLWRAAHVRGTAELDVETARGIVPVDFAPRPYPNGGSLYELEIYVVVNRCEDLASALYYYDPMYHRLGLIFQTSDAVKSFLDDSARSAGILIAEVEVLIIVTARYERRAWKYVSTAYSNVHKNAGVLCATFELLAGDVGLACQSTRSVNGRYFCRMAALDPYLEAPVAYCVLGAKESTFYSSISTLSPGGKDSC